MTDLNQPRRFLTAISTVLVQSERPRVDAVGEGLFAALHRDSVDDAIYDLKHRRSAAVIVSVSICGDRDISRLAALVREFPQVRAVALLSQIEGSTAQTVLHLGQSGVRTLVDVRTPSGWRELRAVLVDDQAGTVQHLATACLSPDLAGTSYDCRVFFDVLFRVPPEVTTVRALADEFNVLSSTLMSRFFRAKLPPPKRYLAMARLVRAARLFENPGFTVANVANHLDYSSPQSFGRHVRALLSLTALEFRQHYTCERVLYRFRDELIVPYLEILRTFTPLSPPVGWTAPRVDTSK